jgi:chromosome segregation ATPase
VSYISQSGSQAVLRQKQAEIPSSVKEGAPDVTTSSPEASRPPEHQPAGQASNSDPSAEMALLNRRISEMNAQLASKEQEIRELRQRIEIRNLSLERLQAQFTVAADAVNKLFAERQTIQRSRWARLGSALGFLPKLRDDLE